MDHNYNGKATTKKRQKILKQQGGANGFEASQDQIIGKGSYANPQNQALYDKPHCSYAIQQP